MLCVDNSKVHLSQYLPSNFTTTDHDNDHEAGHGSGLGVLLQIFET